ncbi:hypothetical protein PZ938_11020 [Luteipulveratus sp. YIM 133132]|uniref:RadC-like JAB domain-containing protein n=1 Tax=Luteipulveratus flavus TaxID=3031728 RepID=A0ABT6C8H2_9MICO|nr:MULTISPECIES: hypothetical protein [unclassified Luteipulveratus]MDE9366137.1 hypothetical protein [Luteipulveratus sp. YIM 133132]MDF8265229.1 hypothetical protein [Luteipulveratus sp. YIM 133296]
MRLDDRPDPCGDRPLDDPDHATAALEAYIGAEEREAGCIFLLLCDEHARLIQPLALTLGGVDHSVEAGAVLPRLAGVLDAAGVRSLVVAVARAGYSAISDSDRAWHQAVIDLAVQAEARLLATYVVTHGDIVRLPEPLPRSA